MVGERERGGGHMFYVHVIQRGVRGGVDALTHIEVSVAEAKGLGAFVILGRSVFGRSKEPEEGGDGEVNDSSVGPTMGGMLCVEDAKHVLDDGDVGWIGALLRVVAVLHGFEERSQ